jgi:transposase
VQAAKIRNSSATFPVDFRKGATGLMALVRDGGADPFSGALYVFRSKRADRIKAVWWDGSGVCLFAKTLEETEFCWPRIAPTRVELNHAQLLALIDGRAVGDRGRHPRPGS